MHIENQFQVAAPVDVVWNYLLDPRKAAGCMPGAELTQIVDDRTYKGRVKVKMGAVELSFAGTITVIQRDDAGHRVVMNASGSEEKGKGQAQASVTASMVPQGNGTQVLVSQDIEMSGAAAQYGRGMMQDVAAGLMQQFANCLSGELRGSSATAAASGGQESKGGGLRKLFGR